VCMPCTAGSFSSVSNSLVGSPTTTACTTQSPSCPAGSFYAAASTLTSDRIW
jgi:hypothetical protein